jgi:hypothetical protein
METKNEQNRNSRFTMLDGPQPWSESTIKRNRIEIDRNTVKVYQSLYLHAGIVLQQKPKEACWDGKEVKITLPDGSIFRYPDDGYWDNSFVNGKLTIDNNKLLVFKNSGECVPIYTDDEITRAIWIVYGRKYVIQIQFRSSRHRNYTCSNIFESCWSGEEWAEELKEIFGDNYKPHVDKKENASAGKTYEITFFPKLPL